MNIASVIVDVPAKQTDKTFDYKIPEKYKDVIKPGTRVIVPFGPRKIQGFVRDLKGESSFSKLRAIIEPLDLTPVLNEELLQLGDWLTEQTLSYKISSYQAMIPAALKAKYEKKIVLAKGTEFTDLSGNLIELFRENREIKWEDAVSKGLVQQLQKEAASGRVDVVYQVKDRVRKKLLKHVSPAIKSEQLKEIRDKLPPQASGQQSVLDFFLEHQEPVEQRLILSTLGISQASIQSLVKKGILKVEELEVYRDPYSEREFERKIALELTEEQKKSITPILSAIEKDLHEVFLLYGVTGSGKTEIYLQSIQEVLRKGKEAIVLVPEISLTPQMVTRFKERFGDLVAAMHSACRLGRSMMNGGKSSARK
ncbi:helicase PriA essential for OriC/DnaA-independent DNA replication [Mesobacillus boroniphilus JCM 21738]|uniref:Helicase PriA essential for OriC/DnaA-independent DNA replication n=1 Tax=Mesobacillus boroniphilus JCM 21738 TaxID=1294265 RepID=W4RGM1_9BACI|nr:helicase PriA essential for OriC/DnaA-independent DNA replication [Mesobacillus boroniphilus JCM 21738]